MLQPNPKNPYEIHNLDDKPKVAIIGGSKIHIPKELKYVDESVMAEILEHVLIEIQRPESPLGQSIIKLAKEAQNATPST